METALRKAGKRVTFMRLKGSDHWLAHEHSRVAVLKAIGGFLHTYLH